VNSELIEAKDKEILIQSDIPNSVWKDMKEFLRYMVSNGSAQLPLRNKKIQIAGKTGTGEDARYKKQWHSWFVGFAPYDAPKEEQLIVAVLVEAINVWEWWAPYASNIIFQGIFQNQTYDEAINELGYRYLEKPIGRRE
jgi:penicillin-binding protein 2